MCFKGMTLRTMSLRSSPVVKEPTGTKVSLYKVGLLSALTIHNAARLESQEWAAVSSGSSTTTVFGLFADTDGFNDIT